MLSFEELHGKAINAILLLRFPLFGGWKTHYFIGYNVPSYEYLFSSGEKFALNMRLVDHIFDDMLVEDMTLKVILPEGAKVHLHYYSLNNGNKVLLSSSYH